MFDNWADSSLHFPIAVALLGSYEYSSYLNYTMIFGRKRLI